MNITYKVALVNNYIVITSDDLPDFLGIQGAAKNVTILPTKEDSERFEFWGLDNSNTKWDELNLNQILDENGDPFTLETWTEFYTFNTGFNTAPGGRGVISQTITDGVTDRAPSENAVFDALATKQDQLVSATNIKTINGSSVLGSGDLTVVSTGTAVTTSIVSGNTNAAQSGAVADELWNKVDKEILFSAYNLYDYEKDVSGFINSTTGAITANATSYVSAMIPVTGLTNYYIFNRTGTNEVRFLDVGLTPLKPLNLAGTPYASYQAVLNGGVKSPATAVWMQFTTQISGTGNRVNTILSPINSTYPLIREEIIPSSGPSNISIDSSNNLYFASEYNSTYNVVRKINLTRANSLTSTNQLDFESEYLADPLSIQTSITSLKSSSDDTCPLYINDSYIGAGHGWSHAKILTLTGHGKTIADVGSIYTNGTNTFTILRIVNANSLWICSENTAVDGYSYTFISPTGTLTYVSDGVNTSSMSGYSISNLGNLFSSTGQTDLSLFVDGTEINMAAVNMYGNKMVIKESYSIYDLPSILDKITSERPIGGYLSDVYFNELGADVLVEIENTYTIQDNGTMLIARGFLAIKKLSFRFDGITQQGPLTTGTLYIPKTTPVTVGANTYDFSNTVSWSVNPPLDIDITSAHWEFPTSPPDRYINKNSDVLIHAGYLLDKGVGLDRDGNVLGLTFNFSASTRKIYPFAKSVTTSVVMDVNSYFSGVAFRQFLNPSNNPTGRTNFSWVDSGTDIYVFLDYNDTLLDTVNCPVELQGKTITVVEKSSNIDILTDTVVNSIKINSTATSLSYGFAVLKLT